MTQVTTAHLSNAIDDRFTEIERWHGEAGRPLAAQSHAAAIDRIEDIAGELDVDCDFHASTATCFSRRATTRRCSKTNSPPRMRAGVDVEMIAQAPHRRIRHGAVLAFPQPGPRSHLKYLAAVAARDQEAGRQDLHQQPRRQHRRRRQGDGQSRRISPSPPTQSSSRRTRRSTTWSRFTPSKPPT